MAEKARFYELTFRDGHGEHTSLFPAQNKDDLLNKLNIPQTVKHIGTKHAGWLNVRVEPTENYDGVEFKIDGDSRDVTISEGDLGYDHLKQLFAKEFRKLNDELDKYHDPSA